MSEGNGNGGELAARIALLHAEVVRQQAEIDRLTAELEMFKAEDVHDQRGWITPGDPRGRVR